MTYNTRPMYGIKESFFGPAAYAEAQLQQKTSANPKNAQSLSVGDSAEKPSIEGYEKTIWPPAGTKQELMGAAAVAQAQAMTAWETEEEEPAEQDPNT